MTAHQDVPGSPPAGEITSVTALATRLIWALIGPAFLVILACGIVSGGAGWLTISDACYTVVLLLMVAGRWYDLRYGTALTITGEPATIRHFRRYVLLVAPAVMGVWIATNIVGNHVLK